jgi:peroxisomal 2,4-dienoyl-CoA reductase
MHYTGYPLQTHVSVAKAGVDALSANVAIEYGPLGLTSNVISPGPIGGTEGMKRLAQKAEGRQNGASRVPLGRLGTVKDIADATIYLFSDASNYVNGEVLVDDGGAWRTLARDPDSGVQYPEAVLKDRGGLRGLECEPGGRFSASEFTSETKVAYIFK